LGLPSRFAGLPLRNGYGYNRNYDRNRDDRGFYSRDRDDDRYRDRDRD
jgi:hypothetical protein